MRRRIATVTALLAMVGCTTTRGGTGPQGPPQPTTVVMEKVRIQAKPDPLIGLDTFDAGDLLEKGNARFDAGEFATALKIYDALIERFAESSLVAAAHYNAALCLERLLELDGAVQRYQLVVEAHPTSTNATDAYYRLGVCLSKLERWPEVERSFWSLRQREGLTIMEQLEARVGLGIALFMQEEYATAEREFLSALRYYEREAKSQYLPAQYWVAQSRFYLGEIFARQFERSELSSARQTPDDWVDEVGQKLEHKCDLLLRSQNNFIRAIREGHSGWATAAGFRIGSLYERLYDDMLAVEVPPSLDDEAKAFYTAALRKRVSVLVRKAITVYERSLAMAERVGESNEWVERTAKALERMKLLALDGQS